MDKFSFDSPIVRIAAVTGEEPADVEAALVTLNSAGWEWDRIWQLLEAAVTPGNGVVDTVAVALSQPAGPTSRPTASHGDRFARHARKRKKHNRRRRH